MGRTMPLVPRMEIPPLIPSRGLKVPPASRWPSGTEMTALRPPDAPDSCSTASACSRIIRLGVELMAAAPTGWSNPGLVTRPTPSPPSISTPGVSVRSTLAKIRVPSVMSGSSPPSLRTAQHAQPGPAESSSSSASTWMPAGVSTRTALSRRPRSSSSAAPRTAAAAQVPVV